MAAKHVSEVWDVEEAVLRLEEFLAATQSAPQRIDWRGRRYLIACEDTGAESAHEYLRRGGPFDERDALG